MGRGLIGADHSGRRMDLSKDVHLKMETKGTSERF